MKPVRDSEPKWCRNFERLEYGDDAYYKGGETSDLLFNAEMKPTILIRSTILASLSQPRDLQMTTIT